MEKTHEQKASRAKQFESYLKASCRVPENKIPFFLHWVSQYHRFCASSAQQEHVRLKGFLFDLSRTSVRWQVEQKERVMAR
jgi:hypothetical protein